MQLAGQIVLLDNNMKQETTELIELSSNKLQDFSHQGSNDLLGQTMTILITGLHTSIRFSEEINSCLE